MKTVISPKESTRYIQDRLEFKTPTRNFRGYPEAKGSGYLIYSYGTLIAEYFERVWYFNDTYYSSTTSQHQEIVRRAVGKDVWSDKSIHLINISRGCNTLFLHCTSKIAIQRANRIMSNV